MERRRFCRTLSEAASGAISASALRMNHDFRRPFMLGLATAVVTLAMDVTDDDRESAGPMSRATCGGFCP